MLIILPNNGGAGLALPQNLITWSVVFLLFASTFSQHSLNEIFHLPASIILLLSGCVLWILPLLWTLHYDWFLNAIPRVLALIGYILLFLRLRLIIRGACMRKWMLYAVIGSSLLQVGIAIGQWWGNSTVRPSGSFQQVNVLASYLATGFACALFVFIRQNGAYLSRRKRMGLLTTVLSGGTLVVLPCMLILLQSRLGLLGAVISAAVLFTHCRRHSDPRRLQLACFFIMSSIVLGVLWLHVGSVVIPDMAVAQVSKVGSTSSRLYMLRLTWQLVLTNPLIGNGYGSFEAVFGQRAQDFFPGLEADTVTHPHNELLLAWFEGGMTALLGFIMMVTGVLRYLWLPTAQKWSGLALLTPLAVHMNLEYPLYLSSAHGVVLVLLLCVAGPEGVQTEKGDTKAEWPFVLCRMVGIAVSIGGLIFMLTGLVTQHRLTMIERLEMRPLTYNVDHTLTSLPNVISQWSRLQFDRHVALLLRYNISHDAKLLTAFSQWGRQYLMTHNNPMVYDSLLRIARSENSPDMLDLCLQAHGRWPKNSRFNCAEMRK